jgi:hypothetical protein
VNPGLHIGDRVTMVNCTGCAAGTITDFSRNRVQVELDDEPNVRWLLRPESLRPVPTAEQVTR